MIRPFGMPPAGPPPAEQIRFFRSIRCGRRPKKTGMLKRSVYLHSLPARIGIPIMKGDPAGASGRYTFRLTAREVTGATSRSGPKQY